MQPDEYQLACLKNLGGITAFEHAIALCGLGIAGEAGEVADAIKKRLFHPHRLIEDSEIILELGDVLFYAAVLAAFLNVPFHEVMERNIAKIQARYPNGFPEAE